MKTFLVLLVLVLSSAELRAQPKIIWDETRLCDSCYPGTFVFLNAREGLSLAENKRDGSELLIATSNGGVGWTQIGTETGIIGGSAFVHVRAVDYFPSGSYYEPWVYYTSVGTQNFTQWELHTETIPSGNFGAQHMFTPAFGYRMQQFRQHRALWQLLVTHDSARTWEVRSEFLPPQIQDPFARAESNIHDLYFYDSLNLLMVFSIGDATNHSSRVYRTTDAGEHWSYVTPFDLEDQFYSQLIPGSNASRYYLLGGFSNKPTERYQSDFLTTDDAGKTWRTDSITDNRIARLANPAGDTLWALVGRLRGALDDLLGYGSIVYAVTDSLFFSPDNGATWFKDGNTFANDSVAGMYWPSPDTCFIPVWKNHGLTMYRGIVNRNSSVPEAEAAHDFFVTPNPATESITLSAESGRVKIYDLIGRKILELDYDGRPIDVRMLPAGIYSVEFLSHGQTEWAKFLKQ